MRLKIKRTYSNCSKILQDKLLDSERHLNDILESITDGFFAVNSQWRVTYVNRRCEEIVQKSRGEILGRVLWDVFPRIVETPVYEFLQNGMSKQTHMEKFEYYPPLNKWVELHTYPFKGGISIFFRDITEHKKVQQALRESEANFKEFIDSLPECVFELDLDFNLINCNRNTFTAFSATLEDFIKGVNVIGWVASEDRKKLLQNINSLLAGEISPGNEYTLIRKDGSTFPGIIHTKVITENGKPVGFRGFIIDITERKKAVEALKAERQRLYSVLDGLPAIVFLQAPDYTIRFSNRYMVQRHGEPGGKLCYELFHGRTGPCDDCITHRVFETNTHQKWEWVTPDGTTFEIHDYPFSDIDGTPLVLELGLDITERKRAEEYFQQLFNSSPMGIVMLQNEGKIIRANKGFETLFGFHPDEVYGRYLNELIVPDHLIKEYNQGLLSKGKIYESETIGKRKDGTLIDVAILSYPIIIDGKQAGAYVIYRDISERKQAEEKLKYLSLHDSLTGLNNRAYFEYQMNTNEVRPMGLLMCDIDGLKMVNDALGHADGDSQLKAAADILKSCLRKGDIVSRIGGDEFGILLPQCNQMTIEKVCQRINDALKEYNQRNNPAFSLSMSIGAAIAIDKSKNINDLLKEADNNMYREKLHRSKSARSSIVQTLMKALEARDYITEGHADRIHDLVVSLGSAIGLPEHILTDLRLLAKFHDIGKVGVPDSILFKPGPLTLEETKEMQRHSEIGHRIALSAPDLAPIADWILKHHEWWNGNGYPLGLNGEEIPLACRILAIIDAYDAMTSDRPYRKAMAKMDAQTEIKRCAGTQFDPELADIFLKIIEPGKM